ncbi:CMRF35-like molecule 8 [Halichoeres trimaculatus]|uniref:CMRF35-like molecule 8 n=1 Tax=Halichoeres trimaculatus TaxID=147232 RepID=UPI003D9E7369
MFLCKDQKKHSPLCEDVSSAGKFSFTRTNSGLNISISEVSSEDQGIYWCGLRLESFRAGVRKINLKFKGIRVFTKDPAVGKPLLYWCQYFEGDPESKFICKGDHPSECQTVISSNNKTNGKFSMEDDTKKRNITITVRDVKAEDNGTYWCGAKNTHSIIIYHRLSMNVAPSPSTTPASTTQSPPAATESLSVSPVGSKVIIAVIVSVIGLLLLVLLSVLIYKWFSKPPRSGAAAAAQHNKENYLYEEIPAGIRNPDPMKTVYATVDFPRNPSVSLLYSTIEFKQSSDRAAGDRPIPKRSSSACEYSSVKPSPADTHTNHQSVASEEPLYSTVKKK